eukprot:TRINITY_DN1193_c0_g7_i1.p1 TRINITY_DN1193_c0_g7~~TRINITY_DN1193_c0_g7_i1.p1  ORF type:complete len:714 (+),score=184.07 TRINITY_DN1193_c0_g7_i1:581-2722(+)
MNQQSSCKGYLCVLANGSKILSSNGDCSKYGSCSIDCIDKQCHLDKFKCNSNQYCNNIDDLFKTSEKDELDKIWIAPMSPFDMSPDCAYWNGLDNNLAFSSNQGCIYEIRAPYSKTSVELLNPNKISANTNKTQLCDSSFVSGCHEPDLLIPLMYTNKTKDKCTRCGGVYKKTSSIQQGEWIKAKSYPLSWKIKKYQSLYSWEETIDLKMIHWILQEIVVTDVNTQILSQLQCSYNPIRNLINNILCSCDQSKCEIGNQLKIGKATACPNTPKVINIPPIKFSVSQSTVKSSGCAQISVSLLPLGKYSHGVQTDRFSTSFVSRNIRHIPGDFISVINQNGINIGKIIADGVMIESNGKLENVQICIKIKESTSIIFDTFDFGKETSNNLVEPFYQSQLFNTSNEELCGYINIQPKSALTLFPIIRVKNADQVSSDISTTEKALSYLIACCFMTEMIFSMILFARQFISKQMMKVIQPFILFAVSTIRSVYFFMVAGGSFISDEGVTEYILIELPTFLYISITIFIALSFKFALRNQSLQLSSFFLIYGILNFIIYSVFIVLVILFHVKSNSSSSLLFSCGGRLIEYVNEDNSAIRTIRISYRIVMTVITFLSSISLFIIGFQLAKLQIGRVRKLFILSMILGVSLCCNSVAFLIYFIIDKPSSWFVLALLFTELVPWIYITLQLSTDTRDSSTQTRETSTSSSSKRSSQTSQY